MSQTLSGLVIVHDIDVHVYLGRVVLVLQAAGHEGVRTLDTVYEIGAALDHALIDQLAERLFLAHISQVVEELVPEPGIDQVAGGMLGASDIEVHVPPVFVLGAVHEGRVVVRVHIAQVVGAAAGKSGHRALLYGPALILPSGGTRQGRLSALGRQVLVHLGQGQRKFGKIHGCSRSEGRLSALGRQVLVHLGQGQRKFGKIHGCSRSVLIIYRERLPPVSLTGEYGIAEPVVDLPVADTHLLHLADSGGNGLLDRHPVEEAGVAHHAVLGVEALLRDIAAFDKGTYGQVEMTGKCVVPAVMGRYRHDGACTVTGQDVL